MKFKFNDLVVHRTSKKQYRIIHDQGKMVDMATVENGITVIVRRIRKGLLKKVSEPQAVKDKKTRKETRTRPVGVIGEGLKTNEMKLRKKNGGVEIVFNIPESKGGESK